VVELSRSLGMSATIEGIETPQQLQAVRRQGCTEVQGHLFGRPCAAADIVDTVSALSAAAEEPYGNNERFQASAMDCTQKTNSADLNGGMVFNKIFNSIGSDVYFTYLYCTITSFAGDQSPNRPVLIANTYGLFWVPDGHRRVFSSAQKAETRCPNHYASLFKPRCLS
jgi:hypothetical protein